MKRFFLATIGIALLLTGCYKDDIKEMHEEIESLRNSKLSSLDEQAAGIEASISQLNDMSASLQQFVDDLDRSKAEVEKQVSEIANSVSGLGGSAEEDIDGYLAEFTTKFKDLNDALATGLGTAGSMIEALDSDGNEIQQKIDSLEDYLDSKFAGNDWVSGTFGTIVVQNSIIDVIEDIKFHIRALNASAEELHEMLKGLVSDFVAEYRAVFSGKVLEESEKITYAYLDAIAVMESALNGDIAGRLEKAIDDSEASVMNWVNEKLDDYLTLSQAQAKIDVCMDLLGNTPGGKSLQDQIADAGDSLDRAKEQVTDAYEKAVSEAVSKHEGVISEKIDKDIQALRKDVINPVVQRIAPLQEEVEKLWKAVGELDIRIKTSGEQAEAIGNSLDILSKLDVTLEEYVSAVKTELQNTDKANAEALQGLIQALGDLLDGKDDSSLPSQIAALRAYVGTVPAGNDDLSSWIKTTYETLTAQFDIYATTVEVNTVINALKSALGDRNTVVLDLETRLDNILISSQATIQGWINTKLTGYYTAAEIEGLLGGLDTEINTYFTDGDKKLQDQIDTISVELARQKAALEQAYKDAIDTAITKQKGIVDTRIKSEFKPAEDSLAALKVKSAGLKAQVESLREELNGYMNNVGALESAIDSLQTFLSLQDGYSSLLEFVTDVKARLAAFKGVYTDKAEFDSVKNYVNGTLKTEIGKIQGLLDRLGDVEDVITKIGAFLDGFDTTDGDLKVRLEAIRSDYDGLRSIADGQIGSVGSLLGQLDAVGDTLSSIERILDNYLGYIIKDNLKSISYVPQYLDQKQTVFCDGQTATSTFRFLLKPAGIAELAAVQEGCLIMKFKPYGGSLTNFESQEVIAYDADDGSIEIKVGETTNYDKLINGDKGSTAVLFYDYMEKGEDGKDHLIEFTSKFIPLIFQDK